MLKGSFEKTLSDREKRNSTCQ